MLRDDNKPKSSREEAYKDLLNLLHEINTAIPGELDADELIKSIVTGLKQLGFDRAAVCLLSEDEDRLCGTWGTDEDGNLNDERRVEHPVSILPPRRDYLFRISDQRVADRLGVELGKDVIIPVDTEGPFEEVWGSVPPYPGYYNRTEHGDNISLPVIALGKTIGSISVDNFITERRIDREDAEILAMFTANMGIILHNARLMVELRQRTAFLESILDNGNLWIELTDNEGNIRLWNKAAEQISGYTRDEVIGKSWIDVFVPHNEREQMLKRVESVKTTGNSSTYENSIVTADGREMLLLWSSSSIKDDTGNLMGILNCAIDVTKQKELEKQLAQSEKISALGQLISGVAHELNNPLTGVIGYSQLLLDTGSDDETRLRLEIINKEANRCHKVVDSLLQFAREYEPIKERVQINEVIESTLDLKRYQLHVDDIELELRLSTDVPETTADPHQMQQVFMNIINNAHQAMSEHIGQGKLTVETELDDDTIIIRFTDTGPGMSKENIRRIFDPFFTTKSVGKGTGLGLSISHSIVAEHDGRMYVDSEMGKGSVFTVEIPVVIEEAGCAVELGREGHEIEAPTTESNILIVDDEQAILDLLTDILNTTGYRTSTARDGSQAMDRLDKDEYDLIICDMKMPGLGGERLYNFVKATNPELAERIIFITGDVVNPKTQSFLQSTGNSYVGKPFRIEEIKQCILRNLSESRI
ncbi:ATP-binding protein [Candidatus Poribacteria bacterium]